MAKKDLDNIKKRLKDVREYVEWTEKIAKEVKDGPGAAKIRELVEKTKETEKHFENI